MFRKFINLFLFIPFFVFSQEKIQIIPSYKIGESYSILYKNSSENLKSKKRFQNSYKATFVLNELNSDNAIIEWTYIDCAIDKNSEDIEDLIIAQLKDKKIKIKLDFINSQILILENKNEYNHLISGYLKNFKTTLPILIGGLESAKVVLNNDNGLEFIIGKNIKRYFGTFGREFIINQKIVENQILKNPLGGEDFVAKNDFILKKDEINSILNIHQKTYVDSSILKDFVLKLIAAKMPANLKQMKSEMNGEFLELYDENEIKLDSKTMIPIKLEFIRKIDLHINSQIKKIEISSIK